MPSVQREVLPNGLRIVVAPQPHLHTATVAAFVKVGSRYEDRRQNGISHFLEHMLFRGSERHPSAFAMSHAIESLGGTLGAATYADFTSFAMTLPPESLGEGIRLLGEVFRAPVLGEIDTEKDIVREEILEALDEDGRNVDVEDLSRAMVFGEHPLGFKITGDASNIDRFTLDEVRGHFARHYVGASTVVVLSGNVDAETTIPVIEDAFGALPRGELPAVAAPHFPRGPRFSYVDSQGSQTDLRVSFVAVAEGDPKRPALDLLLRVLDDGMSTRLHRRMVDEQGLAYDVFARLDLYEDCGMLDFGASVEHAKTPELLGELLDVARELRDANVPESELEKAKRRYAWDMRAALDEGATLASFHGVRHMIGRAEETLESAVDGLRAVTADDVRAMARAVFRPEGLAVIAVGVLEEDEERAAQRVVERFR